MNNIYRPFQPTLTQHGLQCLGLAMQSKAPCSALTGMVHSYLQISTNRQTLYPVLPDGTQALYMSPEGLMIGGALTKAKTIQLFETGEYFGIWFYPGALRHFVDLNLSEITNQLISARYFKCNSLIQLHNEIYKYEDFSIRAHICENWLLKHYSNKAITKLEHALSFIYQTNGSKQITCIANQVGWSSRHLNRQFLQHTGLSAKTFCQIIRAQHACYQLHVHDSKTHHSTLELGYYDQSHLIKAFKKYFNSTPGELSQHTMSDFYNH